MSTAYVVVTILAAAFVAFSAVSLLGRAGWILNALNEYGVPAPWWPWLATAKAAGAAGLLLGLFMPGVGLAAEIGLIVYFAGAVVTVLRARCYSHVSYPLVYMVPVVAAMVLRLAG